MPTLPKKKIGLISCSGEDVAEGLMSRLATLKVLEELRPTDTVTLCLPLFLAGDEKERAFARVFPTIAIDGCSKRCAARATEMYSAKPAGTLVISDYLAEHNCPTVTTKRGLTENEKNIKNDIADQLALMVDDLLSFKRFNNIKNDFINLEPLAVENNNMTISSPSLPTLKIEINKVITEVRGLPLIFDFFYEQKKVPSPELLDELLEKVRLYNIIPDETEKHWKKALESEYKKYFDSKSKES